MIYLAVAALLIAVLAWIQAFAANRRIDSVRPIPKGGKE